MVTKMLNLLTESFTILFTIIFIVVMCFANNEAVRRKTCVSYVEKSASC
jgi:hypothetical protein